MKRGRGVGGEGAKQPSHNPKTTTPQLLRSYAASRDTKRPPTPQSQSTSVPSVPSVVKKTPFTSDPSSTDLGLESPSYKNHKTTTPAFRGFRVFRGPITTQCVSSVKIRVHPWRNTIRGTPRPQRGRGVGGEGTKIPQSPHRRPRQTSHDPRGRHRRRQFPTNQHQHKHPHPRTPVRGSPYRKPKTDHAQPAANKKSPGQTCSRGGLTVYSRAYFQTSRRL